MKKILFVSLLVTSTVVSAAGPFGGRSWSDRYNHPDHHKAGTGSVFGDAPRTTTVTPTATGTSLVTQGATRVAGTNIPITVKSDYARSAITTAAVAASALCLGNPLVSIICGAAVTYGLQVGITKCEEYGWCKTETEEDQTNKKLYVVNGFPYAASSNSACQGANPPTGYSAHADAGVGGGYCILVNNTTSAESYWVNWNSLPCPLHTTSTVIAGICGLTPDDTPWVPGVKPSAPPWSAPGFPPYLTERQGSEPNFGPEIGGEASASGNDPASTPAGGPTVTTAGPQTGPTQTTTGTNTRPDGSVDTTTTTTTPTVTPTVNNNNTSNPSITYNVTNNTTTNVTNNVTNNTTVDTKTENKPDQQPDTDSPKQEPPELPDDYNREITQQKVLDELTGTNAPAAPADQAERTATKLAETDTGLAAKFVAITSQFIPDKDNWFSWVWTPPVGTCNDADFSGTVHGYSVAFSICPWVANIKEALGFLFALFGALVIYGQIFKKEE